MPISTFPSRPTARTTALLAAPAALAAGLLAVAPAATADTPAAPAPQVVQEVTDSVVASPETAGVPAGSYAVTDVRTAPADPDWAAAALEPRAPAQLDPATAVLHRSGGAWHVVSLGTAGVGCEETTPEVARGLHLDC